jgi:hypothetical protein
VISGTISGICYADGMSSYLRSQGILLFKDHLRISCSKPGKFSR